MHRIFATAVATIASLVSLAAAAADRLDDWSVGGRLGGALMQDMIVGYPGQDRPPYEFEYSPGWAGAVTLGYQRDAKWRIELELGTSHNDLDRSSPAGSQAEGEVATMLVMGNVYRDFGGWGKLQPYVGFGAGRAWAEFREFQINGTQLVDDRAHAWAGQLIAGVRFAAAEQWSVSADYRVLLSGELKIADEEGSLMDPELRRHALFLGLQRSF